MASREQPASAHCVVGGAVEYEVQYSAGLSVGSKPPTPPVLLAPASPPTGASDAECDSTCGFSDSEADCGKCFESKERSECPQSQQNRSTGLHSICSQGTLEDLNAYIKSDLPKHGVDLKGCSPLHLACWRGLLTFVQILAVSFSVCACDIDRWSALHYACDSITGDVDLVMYLVETQGCDVSARTRKNSTPLMLAVNHKHLAIVKYLTNRMGSTLNTSGIQMHLGHQVVMQPLLTGRIANGQDLQRLVLDKSSKENTYERNRMGRWDSGHQVVTPPLLKGRIANGQDFESLESLVLDKPTKEKDMSSYETRLSTFYMGPLHWVRTQPSANYLASIGFYFTGFEERVVCFCCDSLISSWNDKTDPLIQHYLRDPTCKFLKERFEETITQLLSKHKTLKYASSSARLHSFASWPYSGHVTSYQLASVGFFYAGSGLKVECFSCGLICDDLKRGDVPLLIHRRRSPLCPFLISLLSKESSPPLQTTFSSSSSTSSPHYDPSPQYDPPPSSSSSSPARHDAHSSSQAYHHHHHPSTLYQAQTRQQYHQVPQYTPQHTAQSLSSLEQQQHASRSSLPTYADWEDENIRLQSFKMLPDTFPVSREDCAKAGLYFLRHPDVMKCFSCLCIVKDWVEGDVPVEKHREVYPECDFIKKHFPSKLDQAEDDDDDEGFDPSSLPAPVYDAASMERLHQEYTQKTGGGASTPRSYSAQPMHELTSKFAGLSTQQQQQQQQQRQQQVDPYSSSQHYQRQFPQQQSVVSHHLRPTNSVQSSGYGSYFEEAAQAANSPSSHYYPSSSPSPSSPHQLPYHSSGRPITLPPSLSPRLYPAEQQQQLSAHSLPPQAAGYTHIPFQYGHPYQYQPPVESTYYQMQPYSAVNSPHVESTAANVSAKVSHYCIETA